MHSLIPILLKAILTVIWSSRKDWFFGVGINLAPHPQQALSFPLIPDGFLCIGVERNRGLKERENYIIAQENDIVPQFVLETVVRDGQWDGKMREYARLGVLYYAVYRPDECRNAFADGRSNPSSLWDSLKVYRLTESGYQLHSPMKQSPSSAQCGQVFWMPEIGLGIGSERGIFETWQRDWLYWYDRTGMRYSLPEEMLQQQQQQITEQRRQLEILTTQLLALGIDPEEL